MHAKPLTLGTGTQKSSIIIILFNVYNCNNYIMQERSGEALMAQGVKNSPAMQELQEIWV